MRLFSKFFAVAAVFTLMLGCSVAPSSNENPVGAIGSTPVNKATVTLSAQYDICWIASTTSNYCVQQDVWNPISGWVQTMTVDNQTGDFTVASCNANYTGGSPMSYPSIYKGNHYGTITRSSGMPMAVSALSSLNCTWTATTISSGIWDAAYDVWFENGTYSSGNYNGAELMIWVAHLGGTQPVGSQVASSVSLGGSTWNVWFGNSGWNVISYVRTANGSSGSFDVKAFINDAVSRGYIQNSWNLEAVEAGFEIWSGGVGLKSSGFTVSVNGGGGTSSTPAASSSRSSAASSVASSAAVSSSRSSVASSAAASSTAASSGGYAVNYTVNNDWGAGATCTVTVKNNSATAVNGWTLVWTFAGNQTLTQIWNATYTASGATVTVKNASYNNVIGANGGTQAFGFNLSYSGSNAKPTAFTLNGTACSLY